MYLGILRCPNSLAAAQSPRHSAMCGGADSNQPHLRELQVGVPLLVLKRTGRWAVRRRMITISLGTYPTHFDVVEDVASAP